MKTKILILAMLASTLLNAQTWSGSTTPAGNTFRTGNVGIGPSGPSSPDAALFIIPSCGQTAGLKIQNTAPYIIPSCGASVVPDGIIVNSMPQAYVTRTDFIVKGTNGCTGIGTATPTAQLEIMNNNAANPILRLKSSTGTQALFVLNNGNVGIGGLFATEKLDVNGNIRTNNGDIYLRSSTDVNHGIGFYDNVGQSKVFANTSINGPVVYGYAGGALGTTAGGQKVALKWNNSGQVAIGNVTTPAGYSLYVESGILAEKFKCALKSTGDWSDFVFDENYKLKSLDEVENYIAENKHLPDVPSAEEVVCEGIDMAKMDAKLLQKIEELTLYTIELKKEIDLLKAKN
ncbi:MAG: hypothetical protein JNL95_05355 [Chitinophagales bacterium]|nr:hypothetical protein [Chitinophagales bacterium]